MNEKQLKGRQLAKSLNLSLSDEFYDLTVHQVNQLKRIGIKIGFRGIQQRNGIYSLNVFNYLRNV
jgi:hypothetical protein